MQEEEKVEEAKESEASGNVSLPQLTPLEELKAEPILEKEEVKREESRSPTRKTTRDRTLISDVRAIDIPCKCVIMVVGAL